MSVDEAVDSFYTVLSSAIADNVPTVVLRRRVPPWFDRAVRVALRLKEAAFHRMRRNPAPETRAAFADRRREFKSLSNKKYFEYLQSLTDTFKTNPKRYWSFLKGVTNKSCVSPVLRTADGRTVAKDQDRAELFNNTFAAKFSEPAPPAIPDAPVFDVDVLSQLHVSEESVRIALKSVPTNKACGPARESLSSALMNSWYLSPRYAEHRL